MTREDELRLIDEAIRAGQLHKVAYPSGEAPATLMGRHLAPHRQRHHAANFNETQQREREYKKARIL